jgi:hypothetical protein
MNEKSRAPVIDPNILLLNAQKAYIRIIGDIGHGNRGHEPAKKSQQQQQSGVPNICPGDNLCYFYKRLNN